ncbi:MAG TPA: RnfABCDGE type electron transport complex subunit D [Anaerohalosphaeraceae bacterium]|nr:RnfABCDGE type electron transport complex subunit D [Anaerohalosphaeraceae bacterium]HOL88549.1 RnfABCDGE type electron transport complex subunit D [Anaerohalosphaeraceae bacterium]HPP56397.1 RnfABCDGE type electron transport complex subunit D [Anaerohalosphaeraceae bacterium]
MFSQIIVSPAPHTSQNLTTRRLMADVLIGLVPAMVASAVFFRFRAVLVIAVCVAACLLSEWICNRLRRKPNSLGDLSAAVTGVILAMSLPPAVPLSVAVIGSVFAIVIVKMLFGGLGNNVFNPAMAARAFLTASFGAAMTTWTVPATIDSAMPTVQASNVEAVTQATPLAWSKMALKGQATPEQVHAQLKDVFWGQVGGCIGETSAAALLLGGLYLLVRKTITCHIPLAVLLSAGIFAAVGRLLKPDVFVRPDFHLFGGGLMLGAFFIATDPVTAPLSVRGKWLFGIGVGLLIMLIRVVGEYPEGVMYAVLIMNAFTPLIDRLCHTAPVGGKPHV